MDIHPAALIFPMEEETLNELAADIKSHGLLTPIELFEEKVIDGRRRLKACEIAGVEPNFFDIDTNDPVAYVISLNLHRRHLTPSQKSMVVGRVREMYDKAAKERQGKRTDLKKNMVENLPPCPEKARDAAGKAIGVCGKTVDFATKVLKQGTPELIKAVDDGRMAVSTAAVYASEPREVQLEVLSDPKRNRTYKSLAKPSGKKEEPEVVEGVSRGIGVQQAHEAIACLKKIPKKDGLRLQGFRIVTDWIKHNK